MAMLVEFSALFASVAHPLIVDDIISAFCPLVV
jgi:hypothetical protein